MIDGDRLPTIAAERLDLRWLTADDVPALFEIFSDPEAMRYWSSPPLADLAAAADLLADIQQCFASATLYQWGVALHGEDRVIGTCTLASLSVPHRRAELGFALSRSHWGHGYASEAIAALVRFAFKTLRLHRLEADVDPRNARSIRCLERAGFVREGYARERYHLNGVRARRATTMNRFASAIHHRIRASTRTGNSWCWSPARYPPPVTSS